MKRCDSDIICRYILYICFLYVLFSSLEAIDVILRHLVGLSFQQLLWICFRHFIKLTKHKQTKKLSAYKAKCFHTLSGMINYWLQDTVNKFCFPCCKLIMLDNTFRYFVYENFFENQFYDWKVQEMPSDSIYKAMFWGIYCGMKAEVFF